MIHFSHAAASWLSRVFPATSKCPITVIIVIFIFYESDLFLIFAFHYCPTNSYRCPPRFVVVAWQTPGHTRRRSNRWSILVMLLLFDSVVSSQLQVNAPSLLLLLFSFLMKATSSSFFPFHYCPTILSLSSAYCCSCMTNSRPHTTYVVHWWSFHPIIRYTIHCNFTILL